jgi:hypothetical protein
MGLNPLGAMCVFLILARRRLYGGMGMGFAGGGMRMIDIEWWQNMEIDYARGGGNQKGRTGNAGKTGNDRLLL